jgi:N-acetylglucosaminyldiphosphoundecaprenol N-acetyl-beta-D-mannosaminyltransferase
MSRSLSKDMNTIYIWDVKFNLISLVDLMEQIVNRITHHLTPIHLTGVNSEVVALASRDQVLQRAIMESDFVNIDNALVVLTLRLLGYSVPSRVATPDLFEALLSLSNDRQYKVYILGAKQQVLEKSIENIKKNYPSLKINGQHGFFKRDQEKSIVEEIKQYSPDMLFLALPSPYKESFILKYKAEINAKVFLGIGGAIDVKAGLIKRAPLPLRNIGLEGIHRTLQNPLYYGRRILIYYPRFLKIAINSKKFQ